MSAIEETKEIGVAKAAPKPAGAAAPSDAPTTTERLLTFGVGVLVAASVVLLKRYVSGEVVGLEVVGLLVLAAVVAFFGHRRVLDLLSSVRFGVLMLVLLVAACMVGMVIMQLNVEGFDKYYADLTPAQKMLYGGLGFFDIYHVWYFNALLLILSLNIILASIDRFPKAWTFISRPKLDASARWLRGQEQHAELLFRGEGRVAVSERVAAALSAARMKATVTEKGGRTFIFGERGAWNRLGAYAVHVALLTIFTGGFLTSQFGYNGSMWLAPGESADTHKELIYELGAENLKMTERPLQLPFVVECTDIQQKLIKKDGPITADNTLDWLTYVRIKDKETGALVREGVVHMNKPLDHEGYRFFQASFQGLGHARHITLRLTPEAGGATEDVTIKRDGATTLPDGTTIEYAEFFPDFVLQGGRPATKSGDYNNPAAVLNVTAPNGEKRRAYAFFSAEAAAAPMLKQPVGGYTYKLVDFEKSPSAHMLAVQNDIGSTVVYIGFGLLALTLASVFFFSHERVWAQVEEREGGEVEVVLGGNTNRNRLGFEDRFKRLRDALGARAVEVK
ncbi:MAG TPA: cytochrome c biogenesis protein ResB [Pyrinomonadaceae bacterium]|nr:cytochrome c biogenesis protein ResB [Pyrinomonadaceae bacterium]